MSNEEAFHLERRCNEERESLVRLCVAAGAVLTKDGNQWGYLLGANLQEGVAGFGASPIEAASAFYSEYTRGVSAEPEVSSAPGHTAGILAAVGVNVAALRELVAKWRSLDTRAFTYGDCADQLEEALGRVAL